MIREKGGSDRRKGEVQTRLKFVLYDLAAICLVRRELFERAVGHGMWFEEVVVVVVVVVVAAVGDEMR